VSIFKRVIDYLNSFAKSKIRKEDCTCSDFIHLVFQHLYSKLLEFSTNLVKWVCTLTSDMKWYCGHLLYCEILSWIPTTSSCDFMLTIHVRISLDLGLLKYFLCNMM
jgi:hypothetical protein